MSFTISPGAQKWIEIIPYGLVGGMAPGLSLVVFKEKIGERRFAVWLSRLQSQVAIQQGLRKEETFAFLNSIFRNLNILPKECYFIKNANGEQLIKLVFKKDGEKDLSFTLKADEAISFCIYHNCKFYCTTEFMDSMRFVHMGKHIKKIKREPSAYLN